MKLTKITSKFNTIRLEITKTMSMEDVSTGVLEKIKNISEIKIKPKNDMMYQDIYSCICQNTKNEDILSSMSNLQPKWCLKIDFRKLDQHAGGKWLILDTTNVARTISWKAWNSPAEYPNWVARCDINWSQGTMLNPIFWKKVQGQKHPGRWGIDNTRVYLTYTECSLVKTMNSISKAWI